MTPPSYTYEVDDILDQLAGRCMQKERPLVSPFMGPWVLISFELLTQVCKEETMERIPDVMEVELKLGEVTYETYKLAKQEADIYQGASFISVIMAMVFVCGVFIAFSFGLLSVAAGAGALTCWMAYTHKRCGAVAERWRLIELTYTQQRTKKLQEELTYGPRKSEKGNNALYLS